MNNNYNSKSTIKKYILRILYKERKAYKEAYKHYKEEYVKKYDREILLRQRRLLFHFKRTKLSLEDRKSLINLLNKLQDLRIPFSEYIKKAIRQDPNCSEWLNEDDTPNYLFETFVQNLITTKQLLKEIDKGVVFEREKEKKVYYDSLKNINSLTLVRRKKLIEYAKLENRQELLSYVFGEKILKKLNIYKEIEYLENISLVNKKKIIRSFYFYLNQILKNDTEIKNDLKNKVFIENVFQICIEYFFDEIEFETYYDDYFTDNGKKKRIRKTKTTQKFNFHCINFSYFK